MGDDRSTMAERPAGRSGLALARVLASGRTSLMRESHRLGTYLRSTRAMQLDAFRPFKGLARKVLERVRHQGPGCILAQVGPHPMWVDRRFARHYILEDYEPTTTRLFVESIRPGATVLDIGAHIGFYTLFAARMAGPGGRVFAFEPCPSNLAILKRNAQLNGYTNVSCLGQAVGDEVEERQFILTKSSDCNSFHPHPMFPAKETISVDCTTVDHFLGDRVADVIKVDAEGAEISVLRGMQRALARNKSIRLFVELNPACLTAAGRSGRDLLAALKAAGLTVHLVDEEAGRLRELDDRLLGIPLDSRSYFANLYCTKQQHRT